MSAIPHNNELHITNEPLIYYDQAITGQHSYRSGLEGLISQIKAHTIDLIVMEALDRMSSAP